MAKEVWWEVVNMWGGGKNRPWWFPGNNKAAMGGGAAVTSAKIYGVSWTHVASPTLTRTDDAVGMVAAAGVDANVVTNNFDTAEIYKDIVDVTDAFGNVFVRIPKFYIEKTDNGTNLATWRISRTSFSANCYVPKCFGSDGYAYIGKYDASLDIATGTKLCSVTGVAPLVSKTIVEFRGYAQANGAGYQQMDIHAVDMLQVLFLVEFATLNSQSIMAGLTSVGAAVSSGLCNAVVAKSGSPSGLSNGLNPCKYRGIENPWGNVWQFIDGININDSQAWVCPTPASYASNLFAAPYEQLSFVNINSDGYPKTMRFDAAHPYAQLPTSVGGDTTAYYSDYFYQTTGQRIALLGGRWVSGAFAGAFCWNLNYSSSFADISVGGRLVRVA
jgi:hypothetical protein